MYISMTNCLGYNFHANSLVYVGKSVGTYLCLPILRQATYYIVLLPKMYIFYCLVRVWHWRALTLVCVIKAVGLYRANIVTLTEVDLWAKAVLFLKEPFSQCGYFPTVQVRSSCFYSLPGFGTLPFHESLCHTTRRQSPIITQLESPLLFTSSQTIFFAPRRSHSKTPTGKTIFTKTD
jgi:hypothetical protein